MKQLLFVMNHNYIIPESMGGGLLCRENWLWLYDIPLHRAKKFSAQLKMSINDDSSHAKYDLFKEHTTDFSDKTYIEMPYEQVKALFMETLNHAGYLYKKFYLSVCILTLNYLFLQTKSGFRRLKLEKMRKTSAQCFGSRLFLKPVGIKFLICQVMYI